MTFKALFLSPVAAALAIVAISTPGSACGCIEPLSDRQLKALEVRANQGDFDAIRQVMTEYRGRGDRRNGRLWTRRAIRIGAPGAMEDLASGWLWQAQQEPSFQKKKIFADAARAVLERGFLNRGKLLTKDAGGINDAVLYAEILRESRAVASVLQDGLGPWIAKARRNDPIAAYHVAKYYFWVRLDQRKRTYWETRASILGDPSFAGQTVNHSRSHEQDLRDIRKALHSPSVLSRSGDRWMQQRFIDDLVERQATLRSRI